MLRPSLFPLMTALALLVVGGAGCSTTRQLVQKLDPEANEKIATALTMGRVHEEEGDLVQAEKRYRSVLDQRPEHPEACHRMGVVLMGLDRADEGIYYLEQANLLSPDDPKLLNDLGYAYLLNEEMEQAETLLRQAYHSAPQDEQIVNNLALVVGYRGRYEESFQLFRQIMTEAEANANLGYICAQRGEGQSAVKHLSRALDLDPDLRSAAEALAQLGEMKRTFESQNPASVQWASRQTEPEPPPSGEETFQRPATIRLTGSDWTATDDR